MIAMWYNGNNLFEYNGIGLGHINISVVKNYRLFLVARLRVKKFKDINVVSYRH